MSMDLYVDIQVIFSSLFRFFWAFACVSLLGENFFQVLTESHSIHESFGLDGIVDFHRARSIDRFSNVINAIFDMYNRSGPEIM